MIQVKWRIHWNWRRRTAAILPRLYTHPYDVFSTYFIFNSHNAKSYKSFLLLHRGGRVGCHYGKRGVVLNDSSGSAYYLHPPRSEDTSGDETYWREFFERNEERHQYDWIGSKLGEKLVTVSIFTASRFAHLYGWPNCIVHPIAHHSIWRIW